MTNQVAKNGAATPAVYDADFTKALLGGLQESRVVIQAAGGKPFLRLLRSGYWAYGQEDTEVEPGSPWAINVRTLAWGWVCWTNYPPHEKRKNEKLGQVMGPMTGSRPAKPEPINGWQFSEAVAFELACVGGEDVGTEVLYMGNSVGSTRAFTKLRDAIIGQLQTDPAHPCPVVTLEQEDYKHNTYGQIFNPIFKIIGWADLGGNLAPTGQAQALPAASTASQAAPPIAAPSRQRRAPMAKAEPSTLAVQSGVADKATGNFDTQPNPEVPPTPVASTQQAHTGQRRRHRPSA